VAIAVEDRFQVAAPIEQVWAYFEHPPRVVPCLPGATLTDVIDEANYRGQVRLQVGPVTAHFQGTVAIESFDAAQHRMKVVARGDQKGMAGRAEAQIDFSLVSLPERQTEVLISAELTIAGKLAQMGGGLIQTVSRQLFRRFGECVQQAIVGAGA
jgi:uncharacterized protein